MTYIKKHWRILLLGCSLLALLIIPVPGESGFYDEGGLIWPFSPIKTLKGQILLINTRIWFVKPITIFFSVVFGVDVLLKGYEYKKSKLIKILLFIAFLLIFIPLLYFTYGAIRFLAPLYPMTLGTWIKVFGKEKNLLYSWWIITAVLFQLGCKF